MCPFCEHFFLLDYLPPACVSLQLALVPVLTGCRGTGLSSPHIGHMSSNALTLLALSPNLKPSGILANTYYVLGAKLRARTMTTVTAFGQQEEASWHLLRQNSGAQRSPTLNPCGLYGAKAA